MYKKTKTPQNTCIRTVGWFIFDRNENFNSALSITSVKWFEKTENFGKEIVGKFASAGVILFCLPQYNRMSTVATNYPTIVANIFGFLHHSTEAMERANSEFSFRPKTNHPNVHAHKNDWLWKQIEREREKNHHQQQK